jgi:hypothetical protein
MKHILIIFIFDKQGKVYLTNINEYTRRTVFHRYMSESDTHDLNKIIKYELKIRIDLKYKKSRLFEIAVDESRDKEYKYYLYCYKIKKFNDDYVFGKEIIDLDIIYKNIGDSCGKVRYDELRDKVVKIIYDKLHDIALIIARKSCLIKRIMDSWNTNKPGNYGPHWLNPTRFGFDPRLDISRYYDDVVCSSGYEYDGTKEFTLEIVEYTDKKKEEEYKSKFYKKRDRKDKIDNKRKKRKINEPIKKEIKVYNNSRLDDYFSNS